MNREELLLHEPTNNTFKKYELDHDDRVKNPIWP